MFDCSKDVHDSSSQDEECESLSGLLFTSQFSCDTDKNIQEKKKNRNRKLLSTLHKIFRKKKTFLSNEIFSIVHAFEEAAIIRTK